MLALVHEALRGEQIAFTFLYTRNILLGARLTMKISIFVVYCAATIALPYCFAGFGDIIGKASDVGQLGVNVGKGIVKKVPELIPTAENLYQVPKQALLGLPFELLLAGIDKLCKLTVMSVNRNVD